MKYSVIIPTMFKAPHYLLRMLHKYQDNPLVGEVLLVCNAPVPFSSTILADFSKVCLLGNGVNRFVNPSWNFGVKAANFGRVILANDDIYIEDFDIMLDLVDCELTLGKIIGIAPEGFVEKRTKALGAPRIEQCTEKTLTHGFGVFMVLHKEVYKPITEQLLVWYGDMYLFAQLRPYVVCGIAIDTPMSATTSTMDLNRQRQIERVHFLNNKKLFVKN